MWLNNTQLVHAFPTEIGTISFSASVRKWNILGPEKKKKILELKRQTSIRHNFDYLEYIYWVQWYADSLILLNI